MYKKVVLEKMIAFDGGDVRENKFLQNFAGSAILFAPIGDVMVSTG